MTLLRRPSLQLTIADVQGDHKADNGDQKIKPHNAGNTDLRKLCGDQRDREAGDTAGGVEDAGCFAFSIREAHRHDCRTQLQHSASGGKADDKAKPVTIIGVGNRHTNSSEIIDRPV